MKIYNLISTVGSTKKVHKRRTLVRLQLQHVDKKNSEEFLVYGLLQLGCTDVGLMRLEDAGLFYTRAKDQSEWEAVEVADINASLIYRIVREISKDIGGIDAVKIVGVNGEIVLSVEVEGPFE